MKIELQKKAISDQTMAALSRAAGNSVLLEVSTLTSMLGISLTGTINSAINLLLT